MSLLRNQSKSYGAVVSKDSDSAYREHIDQDYEKDDVKIIPEVIKEVIALHDDPMEPVLTFRYFLLSIIFIVPGAFIDTVNSYRTTSAMYSIFFVQIMAHWCGVYLARVLPKKTINILGLFSFDLNPGQWSIKETVLVTITANSGATGNLATNAISLAKLKFGIDLNPLNCLLFMWAIVFVGYSYAALSKDLFVYDVNFLWPQALMQTALLRSQNDTKSQTGKKHMKVFFYAFFFMAIWEFFPEFIMPLTSSLAILCWIAPRNNIMSFLGSGLGGAGIINISLDWANITSSVMLFPYWVQVIQFIAFVICTWILIPLFKFSDIINYKTGLMSNALFQNNGSLYPTHELMTQDFKLNQTAYQLYGPVNMGAQKVWNIFFEYAAYVSGTVWLIAFSFEKYKAMFLERISSDKRLDTKASRLNKLYSKYDPIPNIWYLYLFSASFFALFLSLKGGSMFLPFWCCLIGLVSGVIIVIPLSWLYALSNYQLAIGTFNELSFGLLSQWLGDMHPVAASIYSSIVGDAWYRAQYHLHCMRLGFYNYIPPRTVFFSQLFGELIGIPVNYLTLRWVLTAKKDYLNGTKPDPLNQWTGQAITNLETNAINYVLLGPRRLFEKYPVLPYGFLLGIIAPVIISLLHRKYPTSRYKFHLWNTTVLFSSMGTFYGNISTGHLSKFLIGTFTMFYLNRYRYTFWKRYNYLLAAAFDTGYNFTVTVLFITTSLFPFVKAPEWWGNDSRSVEKCFGAN